MVFLVVRKKVFVLEKLGTSLLVQFLFNLYLQKTIQMVREVCGERLVIFRIADNIVVITENEQNLCRILSIMGRVMEEDC